MRGDDRGLSLRREALAELGEGQLRRAAGGEEYEAPTLPLDECRFTTHETTMWITVETGG